MQIIFWTFFHDTDEGDDDDDDDNNGVYSLVLQSRMIMMTVMNLLAKKTDTKNHRWQFETCFSFCFESG